MSSNNRRNWTLLGAVSAVAATVAMAACIGQEPTLPSYGSGGGGAGGAACGAPLARCGASCVDTAVDPANCGACGHACEAGQVCAIGACALSCPPKLATCGASCVDTAVDPANCGACGHACDPGQACSAGACTLSCQSQLTLCGSSCVDTAVDPTNCGACGHACDPGQVCSAGACALSCQSQLTLCGGTLCVDLQASNAHCGACDTACPAGQTCVAGQCSLVCEAGRLLCSEPGAPSSGDAGAGDAGTAKLCVDPQTDRSNCGACGNLCGVDQFCAAGTCGYAVSCADVRAHTGPVADGTFTIKPPGLKPYAVYCAGMGTTSPKEYLTLLHTYGNGAPLSNYSSYDHVTCHCTDDMRRYFEKVRINPATLVVDRTDATFAANVTADTVCWGAVTGICTIGKNLSYAEVGNCVLNGAPQPGNIDLRGLPFSVDPSITFVATGYIPYGTSTVSPDRKVVSLLGGGDCGGTEPSGPLLLKQD